MAAAEAPHRPASQVVRELMREFIQHQRDARDYDEFLRRKVQTARAQREAGQHFANEDVEAEFQHFGQASSRVSRERGVKVRWIAAGKQDRG